MIRAIVFDCFGVLATEGWLPFKRRHFGDDPDLSRRASELMHETNAGRMSYDEFLAQMARLVGQPRDIVRRELEGNVPDEELFRYMATLKPRFKLGVLSNAAGNWLPEIFAPEQLALIDAVALSYETGFIKPQPQAYKVIAQRLGVEVSECLMADDQPRFCAGAQAAGMQALAFVDAGQFKHELTAFFERA